MAAFLFDMDGVIVDSTATHVEAWRIYLENLGLTADDIGSRMLGKHNAELVRELFAAESLTDQRVIEHATRKEALYRELMAPALERHIVPGLRDFLDRHPVVPKAVATNAELANVDFVLDAACLRPYFGAIVDGHRAPRPKPFPDIYLLAADMLGYTPEDCVVFEDSITGAQAGRSAGARVVGVTTTLSDIPDVDLVIRDFLDPRLEPWLADVTASR